MKISILSMILFCLSMSFFGHSATYQLPAGEGVTGHVRELFGKDPDVLGELEKIQTKLPADAKLSISMAPRSELPDQKGKFKSRGYVYTSVQSPKGNFTISSAFEFTEGETIDVLVINKPTIRFY